MSLLIGVVVAVLTAFAGIPPVLDQARSVVNDRLPIGAVRAQAPVAHAPLAGSAGSSPSTGTDSTPSLVASPEIAVAPTAGVGPEPGAAPNQVAPSAPAGAIGVLARVGDPGAPEGIAVAPDGTVFVATNNASGRGGGGPSKVFHLGPDGSLLGATTITGQPTGRAQGLTGLAVEPSGSVVVADASTGRVLRVTAKGVQQTVATLIDLPPCGAVVAAALCEPGSVDHKPLPRGVAVDAGDIIYVTDPGQATIWRIDSSSTPLPFDQAAAYSALGGIALDRTGEVVFAAGDVYALPVDSLGRAGARRLLASVPASDGVFAVAIAPTGVVEVSLLRANAIVVFDASGTVRARISSGAGDPIPLDAPAGLAARGDQLLVTNQSSNSVADHWAVLRVDTAGV
jgi:streptogramin lyase